MDDLSFLEMINLLSVRLTNYNLKQDVISDIGIYQNYLVNEHIQTENYANNISKWTRDHTFLAREGRLGIQEYYRMEMNMWDRKKSYDWPILLRG